MIMKTNKTTLFEALGIIVLILILVVISPFISFWFAYFGGWLAKITIGTTLCNALNTLFNTLYFSPNKLPMIAGALGWIGAFFKGTTKIKEKEK